MRFDILTLFPELFSGYLSQSLLNRAIEKGLIEVALHNIRDWSQEKHQSVDDRPYGGGPGMVLRPEPVVESIEAVQGMPWLQKPSRKQSRNQETSPGHLVLLTPGGRKLTQKVVEELTAKQRLTLVCGRYEGFDQRVIDLLQPDEISIGDYILGGGEVAAMVVVDAVARLVPGVLGDEESNRSDSFSQPDGMLEHAQYTRPRVYRGLEVPEVLLSGNHPEIANWRAQESLRRTTQRRADLVSDETIKPENQ